MSWPEGYSPVLYFALGAVVVLVLLGLGRMLVRRRSRSLQEPAEHVLQVGMRVIEQRGARPVTERYWLWMNLTAREMDVARLAARGLRNSDIARELRLQPGTVTAHLKNIYAKLDIHSRVELANLLREVDDSPPYKDK